MSAAACAILYHADNRRTKDAHRANVQRPTKEQPNTSRKATAVELAEGYGLLVEGAIAWEG